MPKCDFIRNSIRIAIFVAISIFIRPSFAWKIGSVDVIGEKITSDSLAIRASGLRSGEPFSPSFLEDALRKVFALGYYDDIVIRAKPSGEIVDIEIEVTELPQISALLFEGNKKIKQDELLGIASKAGVSLGVFVHPSKIFKAVNLIKEEYAKKGRSAAHISTEASETSPGRISLKFVIEEGPDVRVKSIEFHGNEEFSDSKLRKQMKTKQKSLFRRGKFSETDYHDDLSKLLEFYANRGFVTAEILADSLVKDSTGRWLNINIWLAEGQKYYFGDLSIEGDSVYDTETIKKELKFSKGDVFSQEKLDNSIMGIYFLYQEKGFIYARVDESRKLEADSVHLAFKIDEGIQAHIRKIDFAGNLRTFDKVIRRELASYPGEVFVRSKLMRSVRNVYYLNYFEDVVPDFKTLPNGDVDLILRVTEKPVGKFQIGGTYNTRDKLVGNISIGWPNMLGRGWESEFTWEFGKYKTNFSISFTEPWFLDTPTSVGFDLYNSIWEGSGLYTEQRIGGAMRLGRRLKWPDDYFRIYWRYKIERLKYYGFTSSYNPTPAYDLRLIEWPRIESSTSFTIERDSRDSRLFAARGSKNRYTIEIAGDYIGGDVHFQKQDFRSDWYFPIHKYLTFVVKGKFGYLSNLFGDNPDDVPFGERYFFSGFSVEGQVRGYPDRAITPIDTIPAVYDSNATPDISGRIPLIQPSRTFSAGGRVMSIFTAELRVPISRDQLYISLFGDAGNIWRNLNETDFKNLKKGAGVGLRLVVPMLGVMGIDVGYGFDKDDRTGKRSGWQWHFQLGTE